MGPATRDRSRARRPFFSLSSSFTSDFLRTDRRITGSKPAGRGSVQLCDVAVHATLRGTGRAAVDRAGQTRRVPRADGGAGVRGLSGTSAAGVRSSAKVAAAEGRVIG